jgi:hypothetical protein
LAHAPVGFGDRPLRVNWRPSRALGKAALSRGSLAEISILGCMRLAQNSENLGDFGAIRANFRKKFAIFEHAT